MPSRLAAQLPEAAPGFLDWESFGRACKIAYPRATNERITSLWNLLCITAMNRLVIVESPATVTCRLCGQLLTEGCAANDDRQHSLHRMLTFAISIVSIIERADGIIRDSPHAGAGVKDLLSKLATYLSQSTPAP